MYEIEKLSEHLFDYVCVFRGAEGLSQALLSLPISLCHLVPGVPWGFHRTWFGDTCSQCPQNPFRGMSVSASSPLFPSQSHPPGVLASSSDASVSPVTNTHHLPLTRCCFLPTWWSLSQAVFQTLYIHEILRAAL